MAAQAVGMEVEVTVRRPEGREEATGAGATGEVLAVAMVAEVTVVVKAEAMVVAATVAVMGVAREVADLVAVLVAVARAAREAATVEVEKGAGVRAVAA